MKAQEKGHPAQNPLLEISGEKIDEGNLVGRPPSDVPSEYLHGAYSAKNPVKAIRARCLDCCCGQPTEVRKCVATDCPSWPFRMGNNPFRAKTVLSEDECKRRAALLRGAPPAGRNKKAPTNDRTRREGGGHDNSL